MDFQELDLPQVTSELSLELHKLWNQNLSKKWSITYNTFKDILCHPDSTCSSKIFLVQNSQGKIIAFISVKSKVNQGQIQCLLVDKKYRRRGIGTQLLKLAVTNLKLKVDKIQVGAGAYAYFWPGIPQNLQSGLAFFKAQGWRFTEETVDMILELKDYRLTLDDIKKVKEKGFFLKLASSEDQQKILEFERDNFPDWLDFYSYKVQKAFYDQILLAKNRNEQIVGTALVESDNFKWNLILGERVGCLGALGVDKSARGQGVGSALVVNASHIMKRRGFDYLSADYTYLVDWYHSLGFKIWRKYQMVEKIF